MDASAAGAGKLALMLREPIGVVGAISPFNFPLNLVAHKLAPGHRRRVPGGAEAGLADPAVGAAAGARAARRAGCPRAPCRWSSAAAAPSATRSSTTPTSPMISFTGSPPVGWGIRQRQPRKEVALELGNSTPVIVEADADLELAAAQARRVRLHPRRPVVHLGAARLRAERRARRVPRPLRASGRRRWGGRPDGRRDRRRPGHRRRRTATASSSGSTRPRRAAPRSLTGGDVRDGLLQPTVLEGDRPANEGLVRGGLRAGRRRSRLRHRRRGHRPRQLLAVRAAGRHLHRRPDAALGWARRLHFGGRARSTRRPPSAPTRCPTAA